MAQRRRREAESRGIGHDHSLDAYPSRSKSAHEPIPFYMRDSQRWPNILAGGVLIALYTWAMVAYLIFLVGGGPFWFNLAVATNVAALIIAAVADARRVSGHLTRRWPYRRGCPHADHRLRDQPGICCCEVHSAYWKCGSTCSASTYRGSWL
jgi:hypothetical protein